MAVRGIDAGNYLIAMSGLGFGANPEVMIFGWAYEPPGQDAATLAVLFESNGFGANINNTLGIFSAVGSNPAAARRNTVGGAIQANAAANEPNDAWYGVQGYIALNLCEVWLNGADMGSIAGGDGSIAAPDRFIIGINKSLSGFNSNIGIGEVSVWNPIGFNAQDREDLSVAVAAGANPLALRADTGAPWLNQLRSYYRLLNVNDTQDLSGNGNHLTTVGTLVNFGSHPPVDPVPAAGGGLLLARRRVG